MNKIFYCSGCLTAFESDIGKKCTVLIETENYCNSPVRAYIPLEEVEQIVMDKIKKYASEDNPVLIRRELNNLLKELKGESNE